jgi:crotonobetainyl-CoA:carnitine CoA-transferase CaiB-like acyl-CoA transferase
MFYHMTNFTATGVEPKPQGTGSPFIVPYGAFKTADGMLIVTAGNNGLFEKLAGVLGHPEWLADPRFATNADRVGNRAAMQAEIDAAMSAHGTDHWIAAIEAAGVPCAPIQTVGQVVAHPQTLALDIMRRGADGLSYIGLPLSFDGVRPGRNEETPALGQDTGAVLDRT